MFCLCAKQTLKPDFYSVWRYCRLLLGLPYAVCEFCVASVGGVCTPSYSCAAHYLPSVLLAHS